MREDRVEIIAQEATHPSRAAAQLACRKSMASWLRMRTAMRMSEQASGSDTGSADSSVPAEGSRGSVAHGRGSPSAVVCRHKKRKTSFKNTPQTNNTHGGARARPR